MKLFDDKGQQALTKVVTKTTVLKEAYDLFFRTVHPTFNALTCPTEAIGECNTLVIVYYRFIF